MDNTTKRSRLKQGPEEGSSGSLRPDKGQGTKRPVALTSSSSDEDLKEKRSRSTGLSEEFFLSDLSGK